jgi:hypothetical protein
MKAARGSAGSRLACPRFGSKTSGRPDNTDDTEGALFVGVASTTGVRKGASAKRPTGAIAPALTELALSPKREFGPRSIHPAASSKSPAARTRIRTTDVPHQRRSTFTRFPPVHFRSDSCIDSIVVRPVRYCPGLKSRSAVRVEGDAGGGPSLAPTYLGCRDSGGRTCPRPAGYWNWRKK